MTDPLVRFSSRVDNYIKYRPTYPAALLEFLKSDCGLTEASIIADIGSGTGILSELFLRNGNTVFGVEPNLAMREAAERLLQAFPNFVSRDAAAEETSLEPASVDFITAGQAFHWFDRAKAKAEFARILKPAGWVVLIWNERRVDSTAFLREYESLLLRYGTDYEQVRHERAAEEIGEFFAPSAFRLQTFENFQHFTFEALKGRTRSSSYTPEPGEANFEPMFADLEKLFDKHQQGGTVSFEYDTRAFYGRLL